MKAIWNKIRGWFRRKPPSAQQLRWRASKKLREGALTEAVRLLRRSLESEPANLEARVNLGVALYLQKRYSEALPHFQYVVAIDPDNSNALLNLAACHDALGHTDQALSILQETARRFPTLPDVHYNLALALAKSGRWNDALDELKKELQSNPGHLHALQLLRRLRSRSQ